MAGLKQRYWRARERYKEHCRRKIFMRAHDGDACVCNLCGWHGSDWYVKHMGVNQIGRVCPRCDSKPRQRMLKAVLEAEPFVRRGKRVLHVSPQGETGIAKWLRSRGVRYLSIDIEPGKAMRVMDLTGLDLREGSMDIVVCCHVLEHVENDRSAIGEIHRVLAPGGVAVFQVPIYGEVTEKVIAPTLEDHFHIWHPGLDYPRRYAEAGFHVREVEPGALAPLVTGPLAVSGSDRVALCEKHSL